MDLIEYTLFESSLGTISVVAKNGSIINLDINDKPLQEARKNLPVLYPEAVQGQDSSFKTIRFLLDRYLKGQKVDFDVQVDISAETPFTQKVLMELRKIPYGETASYREIGRRLGYSMAARAVGQAVRKNPIPIIIPCHRIIRENGSLGGFSLGEEIKKRLLRLEGVEGIVHQTRFAKT